MSDKILLRIQKIILIIFLIASACVVLSSFCYFAESWQQFTLQGPKGDYSDSFLVKLNKYTANANRIKYDAENPTNYSVVFPDLTVAKQFYEDIWFKIQSANNMLFILGIVGLILTAIMFVCGNYGRRKYYFVNLISGCLTGVLGIVFSIISIVKSSNLIGLINKMLPDAELYYESCTKIKKHYWVIESSNCWIGIIVPIIYMVLCCLVIAFVVYKFIRTVKNNKKLEVVINE